MQAIVRLGNIGQQVSAARAKSKLSAHTRGLTQNMKPVLSQWWASLPGTTVDGPTPNRIANKQQLDRAATHTTPRQLAAPSIDLSANLPLDTHG